MIDFSRQVMAPRGDKRGFTPEEQAALIERIVAMRLAGALGPIEPDTTGGSHLEVRESRRRHRGGTYINPLVITK